MCKRGSEWHRWDFHVHTPYSILNNNFCEEMGYDEQKDKHNFDEYVINLFRRALDNEISAVGITDYFLPEGYKRLKEEYLDDGKWKSIECIVKKFSDTEIKRIERIYFFLNIELRTDNFILTNHKTASPNVHLLISEKVAIKEIIDNCLSKLIIDGDNSLTKDNIRKVGERIKHEQKEKGNELCVGMKNITVKFGDIISVAERLGDNAMIVVPVDEDLSKIDWNGRDYLTRKNYYEKADCYFTSNKSTINFALNREAMKDFGGCKPCVWGSDAHGYDKMFKPDGNRYCWIKSDLTFDGLRQIFYEPEGRVAIQEPNPNMGKASYNIIDRIEFVNSDDNSFPQESIYFNENLNCIIGGKSTGKSLLLYNIAKEFIDKDDIFYDDNIINELKSKYDKYNANVKVKWKDDNQNNKVIYLPQSYLERIFYNERGNLEKIIEGYLCSKFKHINEVKDVYDKAISENRIKIKEIINDIRGIEDKIVSYGQQIKEKGDVKVHETEIEKIKEILTSKVYYNIDEKECAEFNKLGEEILILEDERDRLKNKLELINSIEKFDITTNDAYGNALIDIIYINEGFDDLKEIIDIYRKDISERWREDKTKLISNISQTLSECEVELEKKSVKYNEIKEKINQNSSFEEMQTRIREEQKLLKDVKEYNAIIDKANVELTEKLRHLENHRLEYHKIFDNYKLTVENDKEVLANSNNMKFVVKKEERGLMSYEINNFVNRRDSSSSYDGDNLNLCDDSKIDTFVTNLMKGIIVLKTNVDKYELLEKCYSLPFNLKYDVLLDDCSLLNSSEGRKAKILLDLIIDLSNEKYPILIDQPEDHLDNRTIYNDLVSYLKKIKKNRQIIAVTHNANVVIGADSEEIIIANQNGVGTENEHAKFEYRIGSIEDNTIENANSKSILKKEPFRHQICNILEGGAEAFRQRENKYQIR